MDILDKIIKEVGNLNDLYYVLSSNKLKIGDITSNAYNVDLVYPQPVTKSALDTINPVKPTTKIVYVTAYQSVFDVCVQYYGSIDKIQNLLDDNKLTINDYLIVGSPLTIRIADTNNKVTNTLFAQQKVISNYDRVVPSDSDIYLGTEDGQYIGQTTNVKIKVN